MNTRNPIAWAISPIPTIRCQIGRLRAWVCHRLGGGVYDHQAGRIVDGALAEVDRLRDELARSASREVD